MSWFLQQFVNAVLQLVITLVIFISTQLVAPLNFTPDVINTYFSPVTTIDISFKVIAIVFLIILTFWNLYKTIFGEGSYSQKDSVIILVIRSALALVLILNSLNLMSYVFRVFSQPFYLLENYNGEHTFNLFSNSGNIYQSAITTAFSNFIKSSENLSDDSFSSALSNITDWIFPGLSIVKALIELLGILIIGYKLILFLLEILERYLLLMLQAYLSPLIWPTLVSKNTTNIFQKWCELLITNFLLMYFNMWFLGLILKSMGTIFNPDFNPQISNFTPNILLGIALVYAMLRIAQHMDNYLNKLLGTFTTGATLGQELFMSYHMATDHLKQMFGKTTRFMKGPKEELKENPKNLTKAEIPIYKGDENLDSQIDKDLYNSDLEEINPGEDINTPVNTSILKGLNTTEELKELENGVSEISKEFEPGLQLNKEGNFVALESPDENISARNLALDLREIPDQILTSDFLEHTGIVPQDFNNLFNKPPVLLERNEEGNLNLLSSVDPSRSELQGYLTPLIDSIPETESFKNMLSDRVGNMYEYIPLEEESLKLEAPKQMDPEVYLKEDDE